MEKPKGRINVAPDGTIIGTGGAAATNYGLDSTPIEILDQNNNRIGMTTLGEVRKKLGLK
ncbi:MAG: hypothetical protein J7J44_02735 [Deltaproteobacteria bacterium]|nr:hypothetical protein [Deltaproteobacteria bacterium]